MSESNPNREMRPQTKVFQVIIKSRNLLVHFCKATAKSPREYHRDLCRDTKFHIKDAAHLLRQANQISLYDPERLSVQLKALENLERANDLLPALEALGPEVLTTKSCSALKLELQKVIAGLNGWIKSDRERIKEKLRKRRKNAAFQYKKSKDQYERILKYYKLLPEKQREENELDLIRCYDEAFACMQLQKEIYIQADKAYLEEVKLSEKRKGDLITRKETLNEITPIDVLIKTIDELEHKKWSEEQILREISKKKLYENKDKRKKYDEDLKYKMAEKEEKFREKMLARYGLIKQ